MAADDMDVTFCSTVSLIELLSKRPEFPKVVKFHGGLSSTDKPTSNTRDENPVLLETKLHIEFARIKVPSTSPLRRTVSQCRSGYSDNDLSDCPGVWEFYIPLDCPGSFQFVRNPGARRHYSTVTQILKDNPRFLRSEEDIVAAVPPKNVKDQCLHRIPAGTVIEPKSIVRFQNGTTKLKCVDKNGACFYLQKDCSVNATHIHDDGVYTLRQIKDSSMLLPLKIQFQSASINPHGIVLFDDEMAMFNLQITNGPLEVTEISLIDVLIGKTYDAEKGCFKTVIIPDYLYNDTEVRLAEFRSLLSKSLFLKEQFGGCGGDNDYLHNTMYIIPTEGSRLCWVRNPKLIRKGIDFYEDTETSYDDVAYPPVDNRKTGHSGSTGEDTETSYDDVAYPPVDNRKTENSGSTGESNVLDDAVVPARPRNRLDTPPSKSESHALDDAEVPERPPRNRLGTPPSTPDFKDYQEYEIPSKTESEGSLETPTASNCAPPPPKPPKTGAPYTRQASSDGNALNRTTLLPSSKDPDETKSLISKAKSGLGRFFNKKPKDTQKTHSGEDTKTGGKSRPPGNARSKLPSKSDLACQPNQVQHQYDYIEVEAKDKPALTLPQYDYVDVKVEGRPVVVPNPPPNRAIIRPFQRQSTTSEDDVTIPQQSPKTPSSDENPDTDEQTTAMTKESLHDKQTGKEYLRNLDFFSYSVEETVECLQYCGLTDLAGICESERLDGEFFRCADLDELSDTLTLPGLSIVKLKRIYNGWRPKQKV